MSHGDAEGIRTARPMKSGSEPGVPAALENRATTLPDEIGRPHWAGATRSIEPVANTPTG
ncbi:Uncharacterised protein [Mycobacterium tuberculosis]|nr:Uncharacterised protein [Mycobacterium tuberculosis]